MWGLWPRCFGYRPQCWKTGTRMLSRYWKVLTFPLMFLLICRKAHRPRTKRVAFADPSVEKKKKKRCCMCSYCLIGNKRLVRPKKNHQALTHWPSSSSSYSSSDKRKNKKIKTKRNWLVISCTVLSFISACWCQGFKTLFLCSGSFSDVSVFCSKRF